jgi:hypothetical protein
MKNMFLFSLCSLLLGSCGNQEDAITGDTPGTPLTVRSVSIGAPLTRATTNVTSGSIGVYRIASNGYTAQNNVRYSFTLGTWNMVSSDIVLSTGMATLRACYPYDASHSTTAIPLSSQLYTAAKDLCYSSAVTAFATWPVASFTNMSRAYTRVTFIITHGAGYPGNCNVTSLSIANAGIKTSTTLDIASGTYAAGTAGTFTCNPGIASIASGGSAVVDILMVPVTAAMSGNLALTFIVDGSTMPASLPVSTYGLATLEPGKQYKINLTIRESIMSATVEIRESTNYNAVGVNPAY